MDYIAVPQKPDVSAAAVKTRMLLFVQCSILASFQIVPFQNGHPIEDDFDFGMLYDDLLLIPFSGWLQIAPLGCHDSIHRAVVLVFLQAQLLIKLVVQPYQLLNKQLQLEQLVQHFLEHFNQLQYL